MSRALALLLTAALAASACDKLPGRGSDPGIDKDRLEAAIDPAVGGPDTCFVIKDVPTGREAYRYGVESVCNRPLAPCATFQVPLTVLGLSDATLNPKEIAKWDGKVQPYKLWEQDTDLAGAWRTGAAWYFQKAALSVGIDRFKQQLPAFGYGQAKPVGRPDAFWMGPAAGGGLYLSTRDQAEFLRKLAAGGLPAKPEAQAAVSQLMIDETRGQTVLADLGATCPSIADASRDVSWWIGRISGPGANGKRRDLVFALSIDSQNPLSGLEISHRMKPILTAQGLLPNG